MRYCVSNKYEYFWKTYLVFEQGMRSPKEEFQKIFPEMNSILIKLHYTKTLTPNSLPKQ